MSAELKPIMSGCGAGSRGRAPESPIKTRKIHNYAAISETTCGKSGADWPPQTTLWRRSWKQIISIKTVRHHIYISRKIVITTDVLFFWQSFKI